MKPLNIHINLTNEDFAALTGGKLPWVERLANPQRIQTVFLYAPDGNHRKPRRISAAAASALGGDPQALARALSDGLLIPRGRKVVFHKGYSTITCEVSLQGLGVLLSDAAVIHLEVSTQTLRSTEVRDARGVEVLDGDTLVDTDGNTIGEVIVNTTLPGAFVQARQAIPLDVFDSKKYIVKL